MKNTKRCISMVLALLIVLSMVPFAASADSYSRPSIITPGQSFFLGHYEQDNNATNGAEPIEWVILDYDAYNNCALAISRYVLDVGVMYQKKVSKNNLTWANSNIRKWLMTGFIGGSFTGTEQQLICTVQQDTAGFMDRPGGPTTKDTFFLLSKQEQAYYLGTSPLSRGVLTPYAEAQARRYNVNVTNGCTTWYLRTPGGFDWDFFGVDANWNVEYGKDCQTCHGIRPAFWLDVSQISGEISADGTLLPMNYGWGW